MTVLTSTQKTLARLALGLPNWRRQSGTNSFLAAYVPDGPYGDWLKMVDAGLAERAGVPVRTLGGDLWRFWLTPEGAKLALEDGESLNPVDFPMKTIEGLAEIETLLEQIEQERALSVARCLRLLRAKKDHQILLFDKAGAEETQRQIDTLTREIAK